MFIKQVVNPGSVFRTPTTAAFITLIGISMVWVFFTHRSLGHSRFTTQSVVFNRKNFHILCVIAWCAVVSTVVEHCSPYDDISSHPTSTSNKTYLKWLPVKFSKYLSD